MATDALGAAASAAAGVVLGRVSEALGSGQKEVDEALPEERQAVSTTTTRSRQKPAKKRLPTKKGAAAESAFGLPRVPPTRLPRKLAGRLRLLAASRSMSC